MYCYEFHASSYTIHVVGYQWNSLSLGRQAAPTLHLHEAQCVSSLFHMNNSSPQVSSFALHAPPFLCQSSWKPVGTDHHTNLGEVHV